MARETAEMTAAHEAVVTEVAAHDPGAAAAAADHLIALVEALS
jgi:DNA-binding FadR family transcriptional regulator